MQLITKTLHRQSYNDAITVYSEEAIASDLVTTIINIGWPEVVRESKGVHNVTFIRDFKAKVYKLNCKSHVYYIKSYTFRNITKLIKNLFRPVESVRYLKIAIRLKNMGIPISNPVLALTYKRNAVLTDSIFVIDEVLGEDLGVYLGKSLTQEQRNDIIQQIAQIWAQLIDNKYLHLDPGAGNFIITEEEGRAIVNLIDIDGIMDISFFPYSWVLRKNLNRLRSRLFVDFSDAENQLLLDELSNYLNKEQLVANLKNYKRINNFNV